MTESLSDPDATPRKKPQRGWVRPLAIVNLAWISIAGILYTTNSMLSMVALLILPQPLLFVVVPWLAWWLCGLGVAGALGYAALRHRSRFSSWHEFFTAGTVYLFAALLAGQVCLLVLEISSS